MNFFLFDGRVMPSCINALPLNHRILLKNKNKKYQSPVSLFDAGYCLKNFNRI